MRIDHSQTLADQPIKRVRDFLRRLDNGSWSSQAIGEHFGIDHAESLIATLVERGLLEQAEPFPGDKEIYYQEGPEASRLRNAHLLKPISREKAAALLEGLLERIKTINASDEFLYVVAEARVFGSFIDPTKSNFGDVDVAIRLERRDQDMDGNEFVKRALKRARESGRNFSTYIEELFYAEHEVKRFLKNRKAHLSLHDIDDLKSIGADSRPLYALEEYRSHS